MPKADDLAKATQALTRLAEQDLAAMYQGVSDGYQAKNLLRVVLPEVVETYGAAAGALAADYYDEARESLLEVSSRYRASMAALPDAGATEAMAGYAVGPLFQAVPDPAASLVLAQGGVQRIVANAARETVAMNSVLDPDARGWIRRGSGTNCTWCNRYIDGVVRSVDYSFKAHDHCNCFAEPVGKHEMVTATKLRPAPELPVSRLDELEAKGASVTGAERLERVQLRKAAGAPAPAPVAPRAFGTNNEGAAWGNQAFAEWQARQAADPETLRLFQRYVEGESGAWNRAMRGGTYLTDEGVENAKAIARALHEATVPEPVVVRRAAGLPNEFQPGQVFRDDGFMSTSVGPEGAWNDMNVQFTIEVPEGTNGAYLGRTLSGWDDTVQAELLLAPGTEIEVISVEKIGRVQNVRARVVRQDTLDEALSKIDVIERPAWQK